MATVTKSESAVNNARRMGIAVSTESKGPAGSNSRGGREFRGRVTHDHDWCAFVPGSSR